MDFNDDLIACASLVEKGDPVRFRTVMAAPVPARGRLFALYAFNVEVARAPWLTQEPMIAEMRLQWWRDALEEIATDATPRRHQVVTPLQDVLSSPCAEMLDELVAARRWDIYKDAFEDAAHFERYIDQTSGHLMVAAARALGGADEQVVRDAAFASGVAAWLRAIPALAGAKRIPLLDGRDEGIKALAQQALKRLARARAQRSAVSKAVAPAMWPALQAAPVLRMAIKHPEWVAEGLPETPRDGLWWAALRAGW